MQILSGNCIDCGQWVEALDRHRRCSVCHIKRDDALEDVLEIALMYCQRLPVEVQEAVHRMPYADKAHFHVRSGSVNA